MEGCISKNSNRSLRKSACSETSRKAGEDLFDIAARAGEGAGEEREGAERQGPGDGAGEDDDISAVIAAGGDQIQERTEGGAADGNGLVFGKDAFGDVTVTIGEVIAQAEDLDLLGAVGAGSEIAEVIELAALGRPFVKDGIGEGGEMGFAEESGNNGGDEEHHQPGRKDDQAGGERDKADAVLGDVQERGEQRDAAGGLAAGAFELVMEDRVFKGDQVEAGGVLHEADADAVGEAVGEKAVAEGVEAAEDITERWRGRAQWLHSVQRTRGTGHHGVDDELGRPRGWRGAASRV